MTANLMKLPEQLDSLPPGLPENPYIQTYLNGPGGPGVIDALYHKGGTESVKEVFDAMDTEGQKLMQQSFLARILRPDTHGNISGDWNGYGKEQFRTGHARFDDPK